MNSQQCQGVRHPHYLSSWFLFEFFPHSELIFHFDWISCFFHVHAECEKSFAVGVTNTSGNCSTIKSAAFTTRLNKLEIKFWHADEQTAQFKPHRTCHNETKGSTWKAFLIWFLRLLRHFRIPFSLLTKYHARRFRSQKKTAMRRLLFLRLSWLLVVWIKRSNRKDFHVFRHSERFLPFAGSFHFALLAHFSSLRDP